MTIITTKYQKIKKSKSDIKTSQIDEKDNEVNEKSKNKVALGKSKENISRKKIEDINIGTKEIEANNKKSSQIKNIFIYLIILVISLLGLILLLDTLKYNLSNIFPGVIPLFDSFYETMLDLKLFFKDLIN